MINGLEAVVGKSNSLEKMKHFDCRGFHLLIEIASRLSQPYSVYSVCNLAIGSQQKNS